MTVSLQYFQRIYGDKLRRIEKNSKPRNLESRSEASEQGDSVVLSKSGKVSILTPGATAGLSRTMLQKKLAIQAYQNIAKGLPSMLK
ncbi:hypothetical protein J7M28_09200 [bacterium]|nr:hypothetical protein [bacterium]